ncbi:MAG: ATP-dependent DNA ligase [Devosia sp.]
MPDTDTSPIEPMEALLVDALPDEGSWQFEPKWDGFRCIAVKHGGDVQLFAKSGKPLHRFFPEVAAALAALDADFILDGELAVPVGESLDFDAIQARLHPAESRIRKLAKETPALLILFDAIEIDSERLTAMPLAARRELLEVFFARYPSATLRLSPITTDPATARRWLDHTNGALDGVIAKRTNDMYLPGQRAMLKVKNIRTADCVVGGFRYGTGSKLAASLLLGLYNADGKLDHVGFTSALGKEDKQALTAQLQALRGEGFTGNAPGGPSRWSTERTSTYEPLRHELVVEVSYDHITGGRFRHGTGLRRWRPDKAPRQCTYEQLQLAARPSELIQRFLMA